MIGDNGLFSKPNKPIPTKSDKFIANNAVIRHNMIPDMVDFNFVLFKLQTIFYYT